MSNRELINHIEATHIFLGTSTPGQNKPGQEKPSQASGGLNTPTPTPNRRPTHRTNNLSVERGNPQIEEPDLAERANGSLSERAWKDQQNLSSKRESLRPTI